MKYTQLLARSSTYTMKRKLFKELGFIIDKIKKLILNYGVGAHPAATQAAIHTPRAELQAIAAAGIPAPAVTVPKVKPAPA